MRGVRAPTSLVVLAGVGGALVEVVGQQALQRVVEGVEGDAVVGVEHRALLLPQLLQHPAHRVHSSVKTRRTPSSTASVTEEE